MAMMTIMMMIVVVIVIMKTAIKLTGRHFLTQGENRSYLAYMCLLCMVPDSN